MPTPQEIIINALLDIQGIGIDETAIPGDITPVCLSKLNRRISQWNIRRQFGSYEYTQVFTLPSAANSYTIGESADSPALVLTSGKAPTKIDSAKRVTSGSPPTETEIPVLEFQQWNQLSVPALTQSLTQAVYLQTKPRLPVLWCYGFSTGAKLRLSWRVTLTAVTQALLNTNIDMQEGYEDALTATLSEDLCGTLKRQVPDDLRRRARDARMAIIALNGVPSIVESDIPTDSGPNRFLGRSNFLSRTV